MSPYARPFIRTALLLLLLLLSALLVPFAQAQVLADSGFASAVPCLSAAPSFATTSLINTILPNGAIASPADPALLQITRSSQARLAPIGSSATPGQNSRIANGLGAINGLAYDDGSVSGVRRVFAAAYLKRSVGLPQAGPGAILEYRFADGSWRLATTVPSVGSETRPGSDLSDTAMADQVGRIGLGDLELAPDGQTLFAMNLFLRQIERYALRPDGSLLRQAPLTIPFGLISADTAVQADLRPFALGSWPTMPTAGSRPPLLIGLVDTGSRAYGQPGVWPHPSAYVLAADNGGLGSWHILIAQDLRVTDYTFRLTYSTFFAQDSPPGTDSWNPWYPLAFARNAAGRDGIRFPEPLVTDLAVTRDGQWLFVGLRDRVGDQAFSMHPPGAESSVLAQGDILTYQQVGGAWVLQGDRFGDFFDDNSHVYPGDIPAHIENFMGAAAITLGGRGPGRFSEELMTTSLLGNASSGGRTYAASGGAITSQQTIHAIDTPSAGKAATLGDVEVLCTSALLGGRLWQDSDGDGLQESGEPAFANVTIEVARSSDATSPPLTSLTTDAQGRYLVAVPPNTPLSIRIGAASRAALVAQGWYLTTPNVGGDDARDSDASPAFGIIEVAAPPYGGVGGGVSGMAVPLPINRADLRTLDLGLTRRVPTGRLGDRIWIDANQDGLQDAGEPGQAGIPVTLIPNPASAALLPGAFPRTTVSDAGGEYAFHSLPPGRYQIRFGPLPSTLGATLRDVGSDDTRDSDADVSTSLTSPVVTLGSAPADLNTSVDLGLTRMVDSWVQAQSPREVLVGTSFAATLAYGNAGSQPAAAAQLEASLPAGSALLLADPPPSGGNGTTLTWNLGTLRPDQTGQIRLTLQAPESIGAATRQTTQLQATLRTSTPNDPPANNTSSSPTDWVRPELQLSKQAPARVAIGDELTYTLTYTNSGAIAATDLTLDDPLPTGVSVSGFGQNPGAACAVTGAMLHC
ncbi:MAG: DUF11 domain-containing protein, partial [Oscillochloris sp.]|nr:DUF11 domain-containing protein [Oscillochloris sp.]